MLEVDCPVVFGEVVVCIAKRCKRKLSAWGVSKDSSHLVDGFNVNLCLILSLRSASKMDLKLADWEQSLIY